MAQKKKKNYKSRSKKPIRKQQKPLTHKEFIETDEKSWASPLIESFVYSLVIIASAFFLYNQTTDYGLVYCDDNIFIIDYKEHIKELSYIGDSFERSLGATYYRPLLESSFVLDYQMGEEFYKGGQDPTVYRNTNLFFHMLGSLLVFITIIKLGYKRIAGFIFGLLVAVHPILTPAASWISGRNDSMITVFILLSFIFMIDYLRSKSLLKWLFLFIHMLFYAVALFTKETAALTPFIFIAYILFFRKQKQIDFKSLLLPILWFIIGIIWYAKRHAATSKIDTPDTIGLEALADHYPTIFALIGKLFLPIKMHALANFEMLSIGAGIAAVIAFSLLIYFKKDKMDFSRTGFGIFWFFVLLLPSLLVRIIYVGDFFDYAEHRAYLPMLGIIIVMLEIFRARKVKYYHPATLTIVGLIAIAFIYKSWTYQPVFENRKTFWTNAIEVYPYKSRGYLDLGKAYFVEKDFKTAKKLYEKGIELNPKNFNLYIDMSAVYINMGNISKSIEYAKKAMELDPNPNPLANYNIGKAYTLLARNTLKSNRKKAIEYLRKAKPHMELAVNLNSKKYPQWLIELGGIYLQLKQFKKAANILNVATKAFPKNPDVWIHLATAYINLQDWQRAEHAYLNSLQLNPNNCKAIVQLTFVYLKSENINKFIEQYEQLKRMKCDIPPQFTAQYQRLKQALGR